MDDPALTRLTVSPRLALDLLVVFSRFELTLKVGAFRQPGDGGARADWTAFANATSSAVDPDRNAENLATDLATESEAYERKSVGTPSADKHFRSKSIISILMVIMTLAAKDGKSPPPVVRMPVNSTPEHIDRGATAP